MRLIAFGGDERMRGALLAAGRAGWETLHIEDAADVEHLVTVLMGDKVQSRKEYIFENADFNKNSSEMFEKLKD